MVFCFHGNREVCVEQSCDFLFMLDSVAMLDHAHTLQRLMEVER